MLDACFKKKKKKLSIPDSAQQCLAHHRFCNLKLPRTKMAQSHPATHASATSFLASPLIRCVDPHPRFKMRRDRDGTATCMTLACSKHSDPDWMQCGRGGRTAGLLPCSSCFLYTWRCVCILYVLEADRKVCVWGGGHAFKQTGTLP